MLGTRLAWATVVIGVLPGLARSAPGQEAVPGGWAPQVRFQSFEVAAAYPAGFGNVPVGLAAGGLPSPLSVFGGYPGGTSLAGASAFQAQPQVVNGLLPFTETIRRQSRKRPRR